MTMNYRQMLVCIDDDNNHVTFCELNEEAQKNASSESFANDGVWTEWSDWASSDRALEMVSRFLSEK